MVKNLTFENLPPAVCVPWGQKAEEVGEIKGDAGLVAKEWGKLDMFGYLYIWYWVQR
jgi:hypothetical protein